MTTDQTPPVLPDSELEPDLFEIEEQQRAQAYRVLNPLAVVSLVLGALSVTTLLSWYLAIIPVAGILVALVARRQIRRAPEESAGMSMALGGLGLSVVFWLLGITVLTTAHRQSVPVGYTEISFQNLQPNRQAGEILPAAAGDLHETRVYLTGYMYPGRQSIRIKQFLLVPTQGHCKFCSSSITPTEMVNVKFAGDLMADFTTGKVAVGGKLLVDKSPGFRDTGFPYTLEADYLNQ